MDGRVRWIAHRDTPARPCCQDVHTPVLAHRRSTSMLKAAGRHPEQSIQRAAPYHAGDEGHQTNQTNQPPARDRTENEQREQGQPDDHAHTSGRVHSRSRGTTRTSHTSRGSTMHTSCRPGMGRFPPAPGVRAHRRCATPHNQSGGFTHPALGDHRQLVTTPLSARPRPPAGAPTPPPPLGPGPPDQPARTAPPGESPTPGCPRHGLR